MDRVTGLGDSVGGAVSFSVAAELLASGAEAVTEEPNAEMATVLPEAGSTTTVAGGAYTVWVSRGFPAGSTI
jgi:hypothetical protein